MMLEIAYPACWYWVDAATTPVRQDPDAPADADSTYRAFDWSAIGLAVQSAVRAVEVSGEWIRSAATVRLGINLRSDELLVAGDWLSGHMPEATLLGDPLDQIIDDGRHRLWLAGQAGIWPLPVLSSDLHDHLLGTYPQQESLASLRRVERAIESDAAVKSLNERHLSVIRGLTGISL